MEAVGALQTMSGIEKLGLMIQLNTKLVIDELAGALPPPPV